MPRFLLGAAFIASMAGAVVVAVVGTVVVGMGAVVVVVVVGINAVLVTVVVGIEAVGVIIIRNDGGI